MANFNPSDFSKKDKNDYFKNKISKLEARRAVNVFSALESDDLGLREGEEGDLADFLRNDIRDFERLYTALIMQENVKNIINILDTYKSGSYGNYFSPLSVVLKFHRYDVARIIINNKMFDDSFSLSISLEQGNKEMVLLMLMNGYKIKKKDSRLFQRVMSSGENPSTRQISAYFHFVFHFAVRRIELESSHNSEEQINFKSTVNQFFLNENSVDSIVAEALQLPIGKLTDINHRANLEYTAETAPIFAWYFGKRDFGPKWDNSCIDLIRGNPMFNMDLRGKAKHCENIDDLINLYIKIDKNNKSDNYTKYSGSCLNTDTILTNKQRCAARLKALGWIIGTEESPFIIENR